MVSLDLKGPLLPRRTRKHHAIHEGKEDNTTLRLCHQNEKNSSVMTKCIHTLDPAFKSCSFNGRQSSWTAKPTRTETAASEETKEGNTHQARKPKPQKGTPQVDTPPGLLTLQKPLSQLRATRARGFQEELVPSASASALRPGRFLFGLR